MLPTGGLKEELFQGRPGVGPPGQISGQGPQRAIDELSYADWSFTIRHEPAPSPRT